MPAKSRSQQRLFGMVHAYQKGEFHGNRSLRNRIAAIARHVDSEDASHFAQTPHKGLPETKEAQTSLRPDETEQILAQLMKLAPDGAPIASSVRRKSFLRRVVPGAMIGAGLGGLGTGALGYYLANKAARESGFSSNRSPAQYGLEFGLWGAGRGALLGALSGISLGVLDKLRGN